MDLIQRIVRFSYTRTVSFRTWPLVLGVAVTSAASGMLLATLFSFLGARVLEFPFGQNAAVVAGLDRARLTVYVNTPLPGVSGRLVSNGVAAYGCFGGIDCGQITITHMAQMEFGSRGFGNAPRPRVVLGQPVLGVRFGAATWRGVRAGHLVFPPVYPCSFTAVTAAIGLWLIMRSRRRSGLGFPIGTAPNVPRE